MKTIKILKRKQLRAVIVFYLIALFCRYLTNKTSLLYGVDSSFLKICLPAIGPALGVFITLRLFKMKSSISLNGNLGSILTNSLIFIMLPLIGFAYMGVIESKNLIINSNPYLAGAKLCLYIIVYSLLEEIGWRGFLQEHLPVRKTYLKLILIGLLWFIWHLNFTLSVSNLIFLLILIFASWGLGKINDTTHSLIAVGSFHALHNLYSFPNFPIQAKIIVLVTCISIWTTYIIWIRKRSLINSTI